MIQSDRITWLPANTFRVRVAWKKEKAKIISVNNHRFVTNWLWPGGPGQGGRVLQVQVVVSRCLQHQLLPPQRAFKTFYFKVLWSQYNLYWYPQKCWLPGYTRSCIYFYCGNQNTSSFASKDPMRRAKESGSNFMSVRQVGDHWHWREPERSHLFDQTSSSRPGERFPRVKHNNGAMDAKWWGGPGEIDVKPATDFLQSSKWVPWCRMNGRFFTLNQNTEKTTLRKVFGLCHLYL